MTPEVWGMLVAGIAALLAGVALLPARMRMERGAGRVLLLGPVVEAVALAMFAAEHFFAARDLAPIVPRWLPWPMFWTYFFGVALLAAAISFVIWRGVRWAVLLLAGFFLVIVVTVDLPDLPKSLHDRIFWTLVARETCFAAGAIALAGAVSARRGLMIAGRTVVALVMVFYGVEHFFFLRNVPGVPLEKLTPDWVPAPGVLTGLVGAVLLSAGVAMLMGRYARAAGAFAGAMLVVLVLGFYVPIFVTERHTALAVEGMNYIGDTLLFAGTVMLAGLGAWRATAAE